MFGLLTNLHFFFNRKSFSSKNPDYLSIPMKTLTDASFYTILKEKFPQLDYVKKATIYKPGEKIPAEVKEAPKQEKEAA